MHVNVTSSCVIGFLILNLLIGTYYGRKVTTIKQYALGGRNFSTGTLVSTVVGTWIGGDYLLITLSEVYKTGLLYCIGCLGMSLSLFITGYFLAPRMKGFLGDISVASSMGKLYGKKVRLITAFTGAIISSGYIAVQFKVLGELFTLYLGVDRNYALVISATVVVFYSAFGGIRSITFTDVAQFGTFGILIPILGFIIWHDITNLEGIDLIKTFNNNQIFDYKNFIDVSSPQFRNVLTLFLIFSIPDFNPSLCQRISIGNSTAQVKKAFCISALLLMIILLGMSWISFLLFSFDNTLKAESLVHYILDTYAYTGLKDFILVGIIAMCISTADSNINSASVILTHDFCKPLGIKVDELLLSKIFAVFLGFSALALANIKLNMLELVFITQSFYTPIVAVPFILAIFGFRIKKEAVYASMLSGFMSVLIWRKCFMHTGVDSVLPGVLANLIALISAQHCTSKKKYTRYTLLKIINKIHLPSILINKISFLSFIDACKKNSPKSNMSYIGFGVFGTISTLCTMYSASDIVGTQYKNELLTLYELMLLVSIGFCTYPVWPRSIQKIIIVKVGWNISIFFLLIFCSSFFVMLTKFTTLQIVVFTLNLMALALLTRWKIALGMITLGIYSGIQYYQYFTGTNNIELSPNPTSLFLYILLLSSAMIIILLKPNQEYIEEAEQKVYNLNHKITYYNERLINQKKEIERLEGTAQTIINNINHELRLPVGNVMNFAELLSKGLKNYSKSQLKNLSDEVYHNSNRLYTMILNTLDLATLNAKKIELKKQNINFSKLVMKRIDLCHKIYLQNKKINFKISIKEGIFLEIDLYYLCQTVDNLIINAITFSKSGTIVIKLLLENNFVKFMITDQSKGINKKQIYDVFTPFKMGCNTQSEGKGRGAGLALCKSVIESHNGEINVKSNGKKGVMFWFLLPI